MRAFGSSFEETVLAWNVNEEFAFRVDVCSLPAVRGLAERWRMRAVGSGSTELTWSLAVQRIQYPGVDHCHLRSGCVCFHGGQIQ